MSSALNDLMQFKVPIPSSFIRRNPNVQNSEISNSTHNDYFMHKPSNTPSLWGGSVGRKEKQVPPRKVFNPMPPPPAPTRGLYHSINDDTNATSNFFYGNRVVHSTPQQRNVGMGMSSNSLQGVPDSMIFHSAWNGSASAYNRGSESVRSCNSISTEYIDKIFTKALNKYLEKNPDIQDLAIHVANGLRPCAQEAALELGAPDCSSRSVYSEKASTWRSGVSVASGRSQDTFHSLLKKGRAVRPPSLKDAACSIQCSITEKTSQGRRQHQARTIEEKNKLNVTTINVTEKAMQPKRLSTSAEVDSSDDECVIPQTVRRNPTPATPVVQVFGSPTIANLMNDIALEKQEKLKELENKKERNASATPRRKKTVKSKALKRTHNKISTTEIVTKETSRPAKKKSSEADTSCISTTISATTTVQCTRSGRNVKKPSFYQVPQKNKSYSRLKGKGQHEETTSIGIQISVSDETHAVTYTKKITETKQTDPTLIKAPQPKSKPRPKNKETLASEISTIVETIVHTRSGRAVKPINIYGRSATLQLNQSNNNSQNISIQSKSSKENKPPMVFQAKKAVGTKKVVKSKIKKISEAATENEPMLVEEDKGDGANLDISNMSFGGDDFFIPEVTQSTRRTGIKGLARKALGASLGSHTPALLHLNTHLPKNHVGSSTPGQQTPDWQISQRTQSELNEFQKRKVNKKNNILKLPSAKKKPSKALQKAIKLMKAPLPSNPMIPAYGHCQDSDDSDGSL